MALYEKRRKKPELMLVPLIDVLTMLIFFAFVTMQFKSGATLNITLPKVETAGKNEFKGSVTIAIDKEGQMDFNGKPATDAQLEEPAPRGARRSTATSPCSSRPTRPRRSSGWRL